MGFGAVMFTVSYFINKFNAIPDDAWTTNQYHNLERTKFCALGHCGVVEDYWTSINNEESISLRILLESTGSDVGMINDGIDPSYKQTTPKLRILAALIDVMKL